MLQKKVLNISPRLNKSHSFTYAIYIIKTSTCNRWKTERVFVSVHYLADSLWKKMLNIFTRFFHRRWCFCHPMPYLHTLRKATRLTCKQMENLKSFCDRSEQLNWLCQHILPGWLATNWCLQDLSSWISHNHLVNPWLLQ